MALEDYRPVHDMGNLMEVLVQGMAIQDQDRW